MHHGQSKGAKKRKKNKNKGNYKSLWNRGNMQCTSLAKGVGVDALVVLYPIGHGVPNECAEFWPGISSSPVSQTFSSSVCEGRQSTCTLIRLRTDSRAVILIACLFLTDGRRSGVTWWPVTSVTTWGLSHRLCSLSVLRPGSLKPDCLGVPPGMRRVWVRNSSETVTALVGTVIVAK